MKNERINFKKIHGIFFDLDGTLVDNEHLKAIAFAKAIEKFGGKSHPSIYKEVMGMSGPTIRKHFMNKANIEIDLDEYFEAFKSIYDALLQTDLALKPGVSQFLSELKDKGIKMAVVSGAYSSSVFYIINSLDINHYFDFILTGDDIENKKPHPESYLLALDRMNIPKKQVIVFEDTESGIKAAENAGLKSIGIRHSYNQSHDLSRAVSEYVSFEDDIEDIKKEINRIFKERML